jgi:hypothetical protein
MEVADAVGRLMKGKPVDVHFDLGEHGAARVFMTDVKRFGLQSHLYEDGSNAW